MIKHKIPFAPEIDGMNGGTSPQYLLPYLKNKVDVLVTDGEISDSEIMAMRNRISGR
jgi:hypothetical protein